MKRRQAHSERATSGHDPEVSRQVLNLDARTSTTANDKEWARVLKELDGLIGADLQVVAGQ
ncbi:MAG: hypothetical protein LAP39_29270 [Acidobacteriia bacterium]|nr:hypothetical protein [Terriglobia bacterium]